MKEHTLHDDADHIPPLIKDVKFVALEDGPRGVSRTHVAQLNVNFVKFLA